MAAKQMEGLEQLLVEELQDLYDAEKQLVRALPKLAKAASDEELANAFRQHLEVTKGQVSRLEQVFDSMDMRARSRPCHGMTGLVEEAQEIMQEDFDDMILDAGLIGAARKVEHYEISGYDSARALAQQLGMKDPAELLQQTLREEMEAEKLFGQISKRLLKETMVQQKAMAAQQEEGGGRPARGGARPAAAKAGGGRSQARGGGQARAAAGRSSSEGQTRRRGSQRNAGGSAHPLTDHEEIRRWAEERGGSPACVRGTGDQGDIGMIRLDFPGYTGADSLEPISWDDWFAKFDERGLALMVQEKTGRGQKSNFNKLVSRESVEERQRPKTRAAR